MCGIAGFAGVHKKYRTVLSLGLGLGVDTRGGHGAGYVSITPKKGAVHIGRKLEKWETATDEFIADICGEITLIHARFATCGQRTLDEVHPFAIQREEKTVLWGCHNGMIDDAFESAKDHGREISVDSMEVLNLVADREYEKISKLKGYGTLAWIEAVDISRIRLVKMTEQADLCIAKLARDKGYVFGSTHFIINKGLDTANTLFAGDDKLEVDCTYKLDTGMVYTVGTEGVYETHAPRITLAKREYKNHVFYSYGRSADGRFNGKSYGGSWGWDFDDEDTLTTRTLKGGSFWDRDQSSKSQNDNKKNDEKKDDNVILSQDEEDWMKEEEEREERERKEEEFDMVIDILIEDKDVTKCLDQGMFFALEEYLAKEYELEQDDINAFIAYMRKDKELQTRSRKKVLSDAEEKDLDLSDLDLAQCPKCGSYVHYNGVICTSCNYMKQSCPDCGAVYLWNARKQTCGGCFHGYKDKKKIGEDKKNDRSDRRVDKTNDATSSMPDWREIAKKIVI